MNASALRAAVVQTQSAEDRDSRGLDPVDGVVALAGSTVGTVVTGARDAGLTVCRTLGLPYLTDERHYLSAVAVAARTGGALPPPWCRHPNDVSVYGLFCDERAWLSARARSAQDSGRVASHDDRPPRSAWGTVWGGTVDGSAGPASTRRADGAV